MGLIDILTIFCFMRQINIFSGSYSQSSFLFFQNLMDILTIFLFYFMGPIKIFSNIFTLYSGFNIHSHNISILFLFNMF